MDFHLRPEDRQIREGVRTFARQKIAPHAAVYDRKCAFPHPIVEEARTLGYTHLLVPETYGGPGLGPLSLVLVAEELGWACVGIAVAILLNNLIADALLLGGDQSLHKAYLPRLSREIASYALTEPDAGSDVGAIRTRAYKKGGGNS